jgi:FkbM family methyltransferase
LTRLGSDYGGWWVPSEWLHQGTKKRVLISVGLGFDVSFDSALLENGYFVIGLDPLKESTEFAARELAEFSNFVCINKGLSTRVGSEKFYSPKNPSHDSWSAENVQNTPSSLSKIFEVTTLSALTESFPEIENADFTILKIDIEGHEFAIMRDMVQKHQKYDFLAIELDQLSLLPFLAIKKRYSKILEARRIISQLQDLGYRLIYIENFNFFWISDSLLDKNRNPNLLS